MTIWQAFLKQTRNTAPAYKQLADEIHQAIAAGRLASGAQLPPQRELAYELGVSIGTVTRAYDLCLRRGDLVATVGRGTFVRDQNAASTGPINLRVNIPADIGQGVEIASVLARRPASEFMGYIPFGGAAADRDAGAHYLALGGMKANPANLIVTAGGQHALTAALLTATKAGDLVLTEPFTFGGFLDAAKLMNRRVKGIAADAEGIIPDDFEALCKREKPKACFLTPTLQNPTGTSLSKKRREAIVEIALKHNVTIIEDALYDPLVAKPPVALSTLAPDISFYVSSLSKTIAPGFRVGYLLCPPRFRAQTNDIQHLLGMGPAWAMAEVASELIRSGAAARLTRAQAAEIKARRDIAADLLRPVTKTIAKSNAPHLWLPLPAHWTAEGLVAAAEARGLLTSPASHFAVDKSSAPITMSHIRISLGAAKSRAELATSLKLVQELMQGQATTGQRSI
ncbi:MAG: PLP-dependent aminotransferase family protein [Parvibaculum sp.]